MNLPFFCCRKTAIVLFACLFIGGGIAYAINTLSEGWQLGPNTTTTIDVTPIGGDCKKVSTPNDGKDRFISTKTVAEWDTFKSAAPGLGIVLNPCYSTLASLEGKYASPDWDYDIIFARIKDGKLEISFSSMPYLGWVPLDVNQTTLEADWNNRLHFAIRSNGLYFNNTSINTTYRYLGNGWCAHDSSPVTDATCGCNADGTWGSFYPGCGWNYIHRTSPYSVSNPPPMN